MDSSPKADGRVEIIERTTPFKGFFRVDTYDLRHRTYDGGWSAPLRREVWERGHAVAVLPYDPERDAVILVEQFRAGALAVGMDPWIVEAIAGIIEEGEDPADVARRESVEEAGCILGDLETIGRIIVSPGGSSETMTIFCGRADSRGVSGVHGKKDEGEDIRVSVLPATVAFEQVADGRITAANAVIPLQWLALNRARLQARWTAAP